MTLPTAQGIEVSNAFKLSISYTQKSFELHQILRDMAVKRWAALNSSIAKAFVDLCALVSTAIFNPEFVAARYEEQWQKLQERCRIQAKAQALELNTSRAWRSGQYSQIFATMTCTPKAPFGEPAPAAKLKKKSKRTRDVIEPGQVYKAPNDEFMAVQQKA